MKGQSEILGIALVVILIVTALGVFMALSLRSEGDSTSSSFVQSNLASGTLDALMDSTITCPIEGHQVPFRLESIMESCGQVCTCRDSAIQVRLQKTFGPQNKGFEFTGGSYSFGNCAVVKESAAHHIPIEGGSVEVKLKIC